MPRARPCARDRAGRGVARREGLARPDADRRDTAAWRLGIHRRPLRLRPFRRLDDVPGLAAVGVAIVALVDLVSAVTPNVSWRGRVLVHVEPVGGDAAAHALAVPVSFALIVTAYYLYRRRSARSTSRSRCGDARGLQRRQRARRRGGRADRGRGGAAVGEPFVVLRPPRAGDAAARAVAGAAARSPRIFLARSPRRVAAPASPRPRDIVRGDRGPAPLAAGAVRVPRRARPNGLAVELTDCRAARRARTSLFRPLAAPRDLPDPELGAPPPNSSASTAPTRSRFQAPRRQAVPLQPEQDGVHRLPDRERRADDLRRSGR